MRDFLLKTFVLYVPFLWLPSSCLSQLPLTIHPLDTRLGLISHRCCRSHCGMLLTQVLGECADRRILEHLNHRNFYTQGFRDFALRMDQQQRVPTKTKEVVVHTNLLDLEQFLP